jgi:hypothetical protein
MIQIHLRDIGIFIGRNDQVASVMIEIDPFEYEVSLLFFHEPAVPDRGGKFHQAIDLRRELIPRIRYWILDPRRNSAQTGSP